MFKGGNNKIKERFFNRIAIKKPAIISKKIKIKVWKKKDKPRVKIMIRLKSLQNNQTDNKEFKQFSSSLSILKQTN
jgi:hypothetical protein